MPTFASRSVFVVGRTAPVILTQSPNQGDLLIYNKKEGVFVNVPALGNGTPGSGAININNTGTGYELASAGANSTLNVKSLAAGSNITLTDDGQTITINSTGGSPVTPQVGVLYKMLDFTSGTTDLITLPAGAIILSTEIAVTEAFDGTPTLSLGVAGTENLLMDNSDIDLTMMGNTFKNDISFVMPGVGNQDIESFFTANGATMGQFSIFIEYTATSSSVPVQNASVVNEISDMNALIPVIGQFAYVLNDGNNIAALYLWTGISWMLISTQDSANVNAHTLFGSVNYATTNTPLLLGSVGAMTSVTQVDFEIVTAFDSAASATIGTLSNPTLISTGIGVNFMTVGTYTFAPGTEFTGSTDTPVYIFFNNDGSTIGAANINISYL
jgi:hypothetical protein